MLLDLDDGVAREEAPPPAFLGDALALTLEIAQQAPETGPDLRGLGRHEGPRSVTWPRRRGKASIHPVNPRVGLHRSDSACARSACA